MAEGFELYHVPQQSRRDKLRVAAAELHGLMASQLPYDHRSLIEVSGSSSPSDLVTCNPREDNLMAMAGLGSSSSGLRNPYGSFDPGLLYGAAPQMMHSGAVAAFKPEPLSLSLSSSTYDNDNGMGLNDGVSRGSVPLGPFTGYASVLKGSRFLVPAQLLLEELCCEVVGVAVSAEKIAPDSSLMVMDTNTIVDHDGDDDDHGNNDDMGDDHEYRDNNNNNNNNNGGGGDDDSFKKKSRLISMLDEVYRRYKQYYQQMQAVVTSFEYVAGLGNAAPYASLAVKAMTRHFRCLKNAIMDQLRFANKAYPGEHGKDETAPTFRSGASNTRGAVYSQMIGPARHHHGSGLLDHQPVWRPQRGLPERAVTVLRAWLFEHFLHPYPTDTDKLMLAKQTGLSRSQVSNWFINARVRLWKPMVEEIHMLETRQAHNNKSSVVDAAATTTTTTRPNNDTSTAANHPKRSRNNNSELPGYSLPDDVMGSSYGDGPPGHPQIQAAGPAGPNGSGVSLTLGLHQDSGGAGMCLAQRFGIGEGYVVAGGAFDAAHHHQSRHFGGQLLRDFVG